jgi:Ca2+-transporting ATPase
MWSAILLNGFIAFVSLLFLTSDWTIPCSRRGPESPEPQGDKFLTAFFTFFVFLHIFNTFNARTQGLNLLEHLFDNRLFPSSSRRSW